MESSEILIGSQASKKGQHKIAPSLISINNSQKKFNVADQIIASTSRKD